MDEGGVKLVGAGGVIVAVFVALVGRLRRPKALALEDKRSEVAILSSAMSSMDVAMKQMSARLDDCEQRHDDCEAEMKGVKEDLQRITALFEGPIPPYTKFKRMGKKDEK